MPLLFSVVGKGLLHSFSIAAFPDNVKSRNSRYLRKEFADHLNQFYWKDVFWSGSCFIATRARRYC
ncbi:MAG: transposase [Rhizonema sp. PD37]|nr:transposase [Rhizonema sp. PD37]